MNEEAGKLLLEDYDAYSKHAKLMTSIHATKNVVEFAVASSEPATTTSGVLTPSSSKNKTNTPSLSPQKRSFSDASGPDPTASVAAIATTKKIASKDKKNLRRL